MFRKRIALVALTLSVAGSVVFAGPAEALRGCVRAPSPAVTVGQRGPTIPMRLEPGRGKRVVRLLRPGKLVWIATTPQLRRICPTHGFYPAMFENPKTYEQIWGWIAGRQLRL
jgi:hypothetical protein